MKIELRKSKDIKALAQSRLGQLDETPEGVTLFNETCSAIREAHGEAQLKEVDKFFKGLSLKQVKENEKYWETLTIDNDFDYFKRWMFAIMSVHTTWESNVYAYKVFANDFSWMATKERLAEMVREAKCGIHHRREVGFWQLTEKFRNDPTLFYKKNDETWIECRDRLIGEVFGLGIAKTTFALNLSFPMEAEVCCLDIHLLRFLGYIGESPSVTDYKRLENEWLIRCEKYGVSASVSREIYWNKVQNRRNSRYWSYCIEK